MEGAHVQIGKILLAEELLDQASAEMVKEPGEWERLTGEALAYHALGHHHESDAALNKLITSHGHDSQYQIAEVYAYRGESDEAFAWLGPAYKQPDPGLIQLKVDPLLKGLHPDPRYTRKNSWPLAQNSF